VVNPWGTVGIAQATYTVPSDALTGAARDSLTTVAEDGRASGLTVEIGGDALAPQAGTSATEGIGVAVAAVVLIITFGSFVAAGLPLLTALLGIAIGVGAITTATGFVDLSSTTPTLALMVDWPSPSTTPSSSSRATGTSWRRVAIARRPRVVPSVRRAPPSSSRASRS
jgi:putative drug exporter of the RND superfamily